MRPGPGPPKAAILHIPGSLSNKAMSSQFASKRVLVTGCCGTVGSELVHSLLALPDGPCEVVGIDNNESALFMKGIEARRDPRAWFRFCDIRDAGSLRDVMDGIDIVIHAAALKHVAICEEAPAQATAVNVTGLQNVLDAASGCNVERVVVTSSDKAVHPNSVMGVTKLLGERMTSAANGKRRNCRTVFCSARFGNVVGSNGSVFHVFKDQIRDGRPITVTDPSMTRFVMSASEAAGLVLETANMSSGGEVFVIGSMPMIRIIDLAQVLRSELAPRYGRDPQEIPIVFIGAKTGEKRYEQLLSEEECERAYVRGAFYVVPSLFNARMAAAEPTPEKPVAWRSDAGPFLSVDEIGVTLRHWKLI